MLTIFAAADAEMFGRILITIWLMSFPVGLLLIPFASDGKRR